MPWHWIDYVIIGIIALSVLTGVFRGFIKELIALLVWISAIWLAFTYSYKIDALLQPYISDSKMRMIAAFLAIFLIVIIVGGLFNVFLGLILKGSGLSVMDRILGMGFGLVRGIFIVSLILLGARAAAIPYAEYCKQSMFCPHFAPIVDWMAQFTPGLMQKVKSLDV